MSNWALAAATRFVEQESTQSEEWARALHKHQTLVTQSPKVWGLLRQALQGQMRFFNEHVGKDVLFDFTAGDQKITMYARTDVGQRAMVAKFDSRSCSILFSARSAVGEPDHEERYAMRVTAHDQVVISTPAGDEHSPEDVAGEMLNGLLGWR